MMTSRPRTRGRRSLAALAAAPLARPPGAAPTSSPRASCRRAHAGAGGARRTAPSATRPGEQLAPEQLPGLPHGARRPRIAAGKGLPRPAPAGGAGLRDLPPRAPGPGLRRSSTGATGGPEGLRPRAHRLRRSGASTATLDCAKCHDPRRIADPAVKECSRRARAQDATSGRRRPAPPATSTSTAASSARDCQKCHDRGRLEAGAGVRPRQDRLPARRAGTPRWPARSATCRSSTAAAAGPRHRTPPVRADLRPAYKPARLPAPAPTATRTRTRAASAPACTSCHTTDGWKQVRGRGHEAGLPREDPLPAARRPRRRWRCEACHGPFPGAAGAVQRAGLRAVHRLPPRRPPRPARRRWPRPERPRRRDLRPLPHRRGLRAGALRGWRTTTRPATRWRARTARWPAPLPPEGPAARRAASRRRCARELEQQKRPVKVEPGAVRSRQRRPTAAPATATRTPGSSTARIEAEGLRRLPRHRPRSGGAVRPRARRRFPLDGQARGGGVRLLPPPGRRRGGALRGARRSACAACHADPHAGQFAGRRGRGPTARAATAWTGGRTWQVRARAAVHALRARREAPEAVACEKCHPGCRWRAAAVAPLPSRCRPRARAATPTSTRAPSGGSCHEDAHRSRSLPLALASAAPARRRRAAARPPTSPCRRGTVTHAGGDTAAPPATPPRAGGRSASPTTGPASRSTGRHREVELQGLPPRQHLRRPGARAPAPPATATSHRGGSGQRCENCHDTERAGGAGLRRRRPPADQLPAHRAATPSSPCEECHGDRRDRGFARPTPRCVGCHQADLARATGGGAAVDHGTPGFSDRLPELPLDLALLARAPSRPTRPASTSAAGRTPASAAATATPRSRPWTSASRSPAPPTPPTACAATAGWRPSTAGWPASPW